MAHKREDFAHANLRTDAEVAAYLHKPRKTLANWRHLGIGPTYVKVGNRVLYRASDVETWIDEHTFRPAS